MKIEKLEEEHASMLREIGKAGEEIKRVKE